MRYGHTQGGTGTSGTSADLRLCAASKGVPPLKLSHTKSTDLGVRRLNSGWEEKVFDGSRSGEGARNVPSL